MWVTNNDKEDFMFSIETLRSVFSTGTKIVAARP